MSELFPVSDSLANKISYYHLLLFMASLPFDRFYSHIILISFIIHTLINIDKKLIKPVFTLRTLLLQSVFIVTVLTTIYSINRPEAFNEWGKQITILLFPLIFCCNLLDLNKYRPALLLGFSLICTATVFYLYADAFRTIRHYNLPFSTIYSAAFTNHNFSQPIDMHATFFSMQLAIAITYLIATFLTQPTLSYKPLYLICIFILLAGLIQLCSKTVFFCLLVIVNLAIPYFFLSGTKRRKFMLITISISLVVLIGIFKLSTFKERYIVDFKADLTEVATGEVYEPRLARWGAAAELITSRPIIGYGAGSEMELLQQRFFDKKYYSSFLHKLNAHSEYLSLLLKSGVVGLLVYLATLLAGFKVAVRGKDLIFFSFMLLITVVSLAENILDVDKGIIFYAFFFSFFMFSADTGKNVASTLN